VRRPKYFIIAPPWVDPAESLRLIRGAAARSDSLYAAWRLHRGVKNMTREELAVVDVVVAQPDYAALAGAARQRHGRQWTVTSIKVPSDPAFTVFRSCLLRRGTSFSEAVRYAIAVVAGVDPRRLGVYMAEKVREALEACSHESGLREA